MCLYFRKMLNIEHRVVIKLFTQKGLNTTEISKELDNVYKNSASSYRTVVNWVTEFKNPERAFEDAPRMGRPSTIIADEDIEAVEQIVMRDRQVSARCLAEELAIIHEVMDNQLGMKKVCTRWILKLLTPIQRVNRVDCCQELLQESEVNPDTTTILSVNWKSRSGEQTSTRFQQERSAGKMMMMIFWDRDGVLLTEYLPRGTTVNDPCYASIIERLRSVIVEKGRGKVSREVLLLHRNVPIHMFTPAIRQVGFIELNHLAYSPDIAPTDYHSL